MLLSSLAVAGNAWRLRRHRWDAAPAALSLAFVLAIGVALWWAVFSGQYDDTEDQGAAILRDNDN
ncbi:outer membrane protein [Bordetella pertussis]|nr:outer membrane protein [Bordetella pertussis]